MILLTLCFSCKEKTTKTEDKQTPEKQQTETVSADENEIDIKELLAKKTPLPAEQLKEAFPKALHGLPLDQEPVIVNRTVSGQFGGRKISLSITDAAGDNYRPATYFLDAYYKENFTDTGDTRFIKAERNGLRTFTAYYVGSHSDMQLLFDDRFHVQIQGAMNPDELWLAFDDAVLQPYKNLNP
jgi:hypothetical protein